MDKSKVMGIAKGVLFIIIAGVVIYVGSKLLTKGAKSIPGVDALEKKVA